MGLSGSKIKTTMYKPDKQIGVGSLKIGDREKKYVLEVLERERLSYGAFSKQLENIFAKEHDCPYGVFCNSGTSALHIALAALKIKYGWQDGDEVIVPSVTFIATSNVVLHNNLKVVFADIDPKTYGLDPAKLEEKITPRTKAVMPVHLFGLPCDMDPIMDLAKKHHLKVVEDSCETMFATYKGKKVGSFGDIGCFSTYIAHLLVTGVGGFALTRDPDLAIILRSLMNHGRDSIYLSIDDDKTEDSKVLSEVIARRFSFIHLGHSFRCTEMEAALGLAQMEQKDEMIQKRRENGRFFMENLKNLEEHMQLPTIPPDRDHVFMMFPILLKGEPKQSLVNYLEERSIETRDMLPLINQPVYREIFGDIEKDYPVAQWINRSGFYIACHQDLTEEEKNYIIETFQDFFKNK